ncbi:hypothetical protein HID58_070104 [Brassica napus]|uniref:Uncharacterized protein n=1 Tax=Brassica napus TaxID=3708 RepID=A0ABQ7YXS7_BRANA|nr:hypothetical protein HID58_070104 [Brassica napus]
MSQFYYLADSVPIKYIFRDNHSKQALKLYLLTDHKSQAYPTALVNLKLDIAPVLINPLKESCSLSTARAAELNSKCFIRKTQERETGETVSKSKTISTKLIVATKNNIRMQGKSSMSCLLSSYIFRIKNRRKRCIDGKTLASLAKFMVFEMPDT